LRFIKFPIQGFAAEMFCKNNKRNYIISIYHMNIKQLMAFAGKKAEI